MTLSTQTGAVEPLVSGDRRAADRVLVWCCLASVTVLALLLMTMGYGRDQGIYAMVAQITLDGGMPYRDAFDFKPPGIFLVYMAAHLLFGSAQYGIRVLESLGLVLTILGMAKLSKRHFGDARIGLLGGTFFALTHVQLDFWHTGQPESFGGMLSIAALVTASHARDHDHQIAGGRRRHFWWLVCTGALFGLAGLMKPPLAGGGAVLAIAMAIEGGWRDRTRWLQRAWRPLVAVGIGGALPFVLVGAWFALRGATTDLRQVLFEFTPHYTALSWEGQNVWSMVYFGVSHWLLAYSSLIAAGMLLLFVFRPKPQHLPLVVATVGILAMQLVGVILQAKFFPYHYAGTWPLAGLLAGLGFWRLWQYCRRHIAGVAVYAVAIVAIGSLRTATKDVYGTFQSRSLMRASLFFGTSGDQSEIDELATVADVDAGQNRRVAEALRYLVPPDQKVFVWGFEPVIYDLAHRRSATRFIYNVPQRSEWQSVPMRQALMRDLEQSPPFAIVVEHGDVFPWVTGNNLDSAGALSDFQPLNAMIQSRYHWVETIDDFDIYLDNLAAPANPIQ